jgi:hypothetical protein
MLPRLGAMVHQGEAVLRQRVCSQVECRAVFWICEHCDRGQRYCGSACRTEARLKQRRSANRRYQHSPEGRLDHRDRQREYRRRRARVTDQGSHSITFPALSRSEGTTPTTVCSSSSNATCRQPRPEKRPIPFLRCIVCGRSGRFVDPYPQTPRFRRERR